MVPNKQTKNAKACATLTAQFQGHTIEVVVFSRCIYFLSHSLRQLK